MAGPAFRLERIRGCAGGANGGLVTNADREWNQKVLETQEGLATKK